MKEKKHIREAIINATIQKIGKRTGYKVQKVTYLYEVIIITSRAQQQVGSLKNTEDLSQRRYTRENRRKKNETEPGGNGALGRGKNVSKI